MVTCFFIVCRYLLNVTRSSKLFRGFLFLKHSSRLMIWECFCILSNLILFNYCCRRHTMHGNMVFCTHYLLEFYLCARFNVIFFTKCKHLLISYITLLCRDVVIIYHYMYTYCLLHDLSGDFLRHCVNV